MHLTSVVAIHIPANTARPGTASTAKPKASTARPRGSTAITARAKASTARVKVKAKETRSPKTQST